MDLSALKVYKTRKITPNWYLRKRVQLAVINAAWRRSTKLKDPGSLRSKWAWNARYPGIVWYQRSVRKLIAFFSPLLVGWFLSKISPINQSIEKLADSSPHLGEGVGGSDHGSGSKSERRFKFKVHQYCPPPPLTSRHSRQQNSWTN